MLRSMRHFAFSGENRLNTFAFLVMLFVVAVFHWNTDPEACGSDPIASVRPAAPMMLASITKPLPVKPEIQQVLDQVEVPRSRAMLWPQQPRLLPASRLRSPSQLKKSSPRWREQC